MRPLTGNLPARERGLLVLAIVGALYEFAGRFYWTPQSFTLDHITHIVGARSLLAGLGVAFPVVNPSNFCSFEYGTIVDWPPGYSLALAPFLAISGDVVTAVMSLDFVLVFLLFVSWWWTTYQLRAGLSFHVRLCLIGWWLVVASPPWNAGSGDLFSFAFFSLAFALTIGAIGRLNAGLGVAAGLAAGVAALGRYAYWPLVVVAPIATLLAGGKNRAFIKLAFFQSLSGGGVVLIAYLRNQLLADPATLLSTNLRNDILGFFPEQLSEIIPFPAAVVGIYGVFAPGGFFRTFSPSLESMIQVLMWILSAGLLVAVARGLTAGFRDADGPAQGSDRTLKRVASTFAAVAACVTFALLVYLSLRYPAIEYPGPGDYWVYLAEIRYYLPMAPAFFLGLGWFCEDCLERTSRSSRVLLAVVGCSVVMAFAPAALRAKRIVQVHLSGELPVRQADANRFREALDVEIAMATARGGTVVYVDEDQYRREWAALAGAAIFPARDLERLDLSVCDGITVLAALDTVDASDHMRSLWEQLRSIGGIENGNFENIQFMRYPPESK